MSDTARRNWPILYLRKRWRKSLRNVIQQCARICAHPGGSTTSFIGKDKDNIVPTFAQLFFRFLIPFMQSPADGSMGILTGMLVPDAKSGVLYGPRGWFGIRGNAVPNKSKACETDPESMEMLWRMSEEATGVSFKL